MSEKADLEGVTRAITEVGLDGYLSELPNGLETYISRRLADDGTELSGGQGQKLSIARAVYRNTPALVLDEPTANLDPRSESEIYNDFLRVTEGKTTIFVSHRLAASTMADKIAVFSAGKIVEYGSHTALIREGGTYSEMFRRQSRPYIESTGT